MRRRVRLDSVSAAAPLSRTAPQPKKRMKDALAKLAADPSGRSAGLHVKERTTGEELPALLRLRLGDWRAVFAGRERDVVVLKVFHREEGYGWLERIDKSELMKEDGP